MSALSLRLPESLHSQIRLLAKKEGISINQFIASAAAEKLSALMTEQYLYDRAQRGDKQAFSRAMSKVANIEPDALDRY